MKSGAGKSGEKFDLVYVCSLVADVHYTLFKGGIAMNPRCRPAQFSLLLLNMIEPCATSLSEDVPISTDWFLRNLVLPVPLHLYTKRSWQTARKGHD